MLALVPPTTSWPAGSVLAGSVSSWNDRAAIVVGGGSKVAQK